MTTTLREVMMNTMDNLAGADFKRFKHYLREQGQIPWRKLERADTDDAVDAMVKMYSTGAGRVMLTILKKMNHNQLAESLERDLGSGQAEGAGGVKAGGISMTVAAHSGGMVNAPAISGSTITGPVNFGFGGAPVPHQEGAPNYGNYSHGQTGSTCGKDFFTKHKGELELRLGNLAPLLIDLERCAALSSVEREEVESQPTGQRSNRALIAMLARKGGTAQEKFYEALRKHDRLLLEDLERSPL